MGDDLTLNLSMAVPPPMPPRTVGAPDAASPPAISLPQGASGEVVHAPTQGATALRGEQLAARGSSEAERMVPTAHRSSKQLHATGHIDVDRPRAARAKHGAVGDHDPLLSAGFINKRRFERVHLGAHLAQTLGIEEDDGDGSDSQDESAFEEEQQRALNRYLFERRVELLSKKKQTLFMDATAGKHLRERTGERMLSEAELLDRVLAAHDRERSSEKLLLVRDENGRRAASLALVLAKQCAPPRAYTFYPTYTPAHTSHSHITHASPSTWRATSDTRTLGLLCWGMLGAGS